MFNMPMLGIFFFSTNYSIWSDNYFFTLTYFINTLGLKIHRNHQIQIEKKKLFITIKGWLNHFFLFCKMTKNGKIYGKKCPSHPIALLHLDKYILYYQIKTIISPVLRGLSMSNKNWERVSNPHFRVKLTAPWRCHVIWSSQREHWHLEASHVKIKKQNNKMSWR